MHPTLAFLSWTPADLVNHLWQSSVIALALLLLMALCSRLSARTRLALGWMALVKFALPFGVFAAFVTLLGGNPEHWFAARLFPVPFALETSAAAAPAVATAIVRPPLSISTGASGLAAAALSPDTSPALPTRVAHLPLPEILTFLWVLGCAGLYSWWIIGGIRMRQLLLAEATAVSPEMARHIAAAAAKAGVGKIPRCLSVRQGSGPGLLGVFSPILTLPHGLEKHLTPAELESVLLHEFIHFRRRDPLSLAVHVVVVSALWFNPVAWLLSRWIRLETEKSCDERVLELTGQPDTYAQGILKVVHLALGLPEPHLLSLITPPVVSRVKNILGHGSRPDRRWLRATVLASGSLLLALGGSPGSLASTTKPPADPGPAKAPAMTGALFSPQAGNDSKYSFAPASPAISPIALLAQNTFIPQGAVPAEAPARGSDLSAANLNREIPAIDFPDGDVAEGALVKSVEADPEQPGDPVLALDLPEQEISIVAMTGEVAGPVATVPTKPEILTSPGPEPDGTTGLARAANPPPALDQPLDQAPVPSSARPPAPAPVFAAVSFITTAPAEFVPSELLSRVAALSRPVFDLKDLDQSPKPLAQDRPVYPATLKRQGVEGFVDVGFVVDTKGFVQNARVISSSQREFEQAALEAVMKWKFQPGRNGGASVATRSSVVINFRITGPQSTPVRTRPVAVFASVSSAVPPAGAAAGTPLDGTKTYALKELDALPFPTLQSPPTYPANLKRLGVEGRATIAFIVDEKGKVQNVHAIDSTDSRFEDAAVSAVGRWQFKPGKKAGQAVPTVMEVTLNFHQAGARF